MNAGRLAALGVYAVLGALFFLAARERRPPAAPPIADARGGTTSVLVRQPRDGECPNILVRITLGPGAARRAGIESRPVEARTISETLRVTAETRYAPTSYARVAPRIPGIVRDVKTALGRDVRAGETMAVIDSVDFGNAKSDLLQAIAVRDLRRKTHDQEKTLFENHAIPARNVAAAATALEEAELDVLRARQRLASLGVESSAIDALVQTRDLSPLMPVVAPFAGVVLNAAAVLGDAAAPDRPLFAVADVARLWLTLDVYETDLPNVHPGQAVSFTVDGLPGRPFTGAVLTIGAEVDDRTRTVPVFAEIENTDRLLRANMFGRAELEIAPPGPRLVVPKSALHSDGDCSFVFVSPAPDVFQARAVRLGAVYAAGYEILDGLDAGDAVVTTGGFLLKSELLKAEMGAG